MCSRLAVGHRHRWLAIAPGNRCDGGRGGLRRYRMVGRHVADRPSAVAGTDRSWDARNAYNQPAGRKCSAIGPRSGMRGRRSAIPRNSTFPIAQAISVLIPISIFRRSIVRAMQARKQRLDFGVRQVSVIIAALNSARTIGRAVVSALAQPETAEVLFVDDGSTDETADVARAAAKGSDRLKLIVLPTNK